MSNQDGRVVINIDSNASKVARDFQNLTNDTSKYERILRNVAGTSNATLPIYDKIRAKLKEQQAAANSSWAWLDTKTGKKCEYKKINVSNAKKLYDYFEKNIKRNERYIFVFQPHYGSGHVVQVSKKLNGSIRFYDPQNGESYDENYLKSVRYRLNFKNISIGESPKILRIDDKELNIEMLNEIIEPTKNKP